MVDRHVASRSQSSDVIGPEEYARWRETYLGALTEQIEAASIFQLAGDVRGRRLLDLGCADGTYSIAASQKGAAVTGLDISEAMLESAGRRATAIGASVEWCQASAESIPYGSETFDIVLAVTLLCFVKEPLQVMRDPVECSSSVSLGDTAPGRCGAGRVGGLARRGGERRISGPSVNCGNCSSRQALGIPRGKRACITHPWLWRRTFLANTTTHSFS